MRDRAGHYAILVAVSAALTLPNLGGPGLWDDDEGVNAQAAREMQDAGTWIVPSFNYQLRTAKPVLLYWAQRASYAVFGVSEWSARLPSVLAGWLTVLLTYELGRRMFGPRTGLLAGIVLASCFQFGMLSHAATPDATLLAFTVLALFAFWVGHANGSRSWWLGTAAACGFAVLTKGPVGVALPGLVILLYFAWNRELRRLWDKRLFAASLVFLLVAGPWYAFVASETRGEWVRTFVGRENVGRFTNTMDGHNGAVWYYPAAIIVMFAPWSAFLIAVLWYGVRGARRAPQVSGDGVLDCSPAPQTQGEGQTGSIQAHRFLVCWFAAYLVFFTLAATKLPNYIFPLYPALAILTARFLTAWREGSLTLRPWVMPVAAVAMILIGITFIGTLALAGRALPGLGVWGVLGVVPVIGGLGMLAAIHRGNRSGVVACAAVASVAFLGISVAFPPAVVDRYKAPRELVRASGVNDPTRDLRVAAYRWFQPSVVFYSGREVLRIDTEETAATFLSVPTPAYVFVPEQVWESTLAPRVAVPWRIAARHYDFLTKSEVLVVTNDLHTETVRR